HLRAGNIFGKNLIIQIHIGQIKRNVVSSFFLDRVSQFLVAHGRQRNFLHDHRVTAEAVATALVLIWFSAKSFEIAEETVPESTIMESTTMSGARGSTPRWTTSICPPFFFSSTALMLEEPTSRPTIDLAPNPNMCPPLQLPGSFD